MAGAGALPGRAALEARRQGWQVVAFAFDQAPGLEEAAHQVVPSRLTDLGAVLAEFRARRVEAALFVGKFAKATAFAGAAGADATGQELAREGLSDAALGDQAVQVLAALGIRVLDQREFLGAGLARAAALTAREPSPAEWAEIHAGARVARLLAAAGIGQTVVRARGVTVAVEAAEGTDETIRRGVRLAGPGAVVVKMVAPDHDYRFDTPSVGLATVEAMAQGGATALALLRDRVLVVDAAEVVRRAEAAGIAMVTVDERA
jgi:DUF1009 family protein